MTLIDDRSKVALTLQVEPLARDAGAFVVRVPGRGLYVGRAGAAMRVASPTSVVVHYEGSAVLRAHTAPGDTTTGTDARPLAVSVSLQAQVDPAHRTGQATLTHGADRYHLVVAATGKADLLPTLRSFEAATLAADWATLYTLMNSDVARSYTAASFAAEADAQLATVGRITALRRLSIGDVQTNDLGARSVVVAYEAELRAPGGPVTLTTYDAHFLRQAEAWKLWFTAPR